MSTPLDSPGDITRQEDLQATGEERASPAVWRYDRATRATVIVDAADYFQCMQQAMMNAKKRILLIGWDFDTRIALGRGRRTAHSARGVHLELEPRREQHRLHVEGRVLEQSRRFADGDERRVAVEVVGV